MDDVVIDVFVVQRVPAFSDVVTKCVWGEGVEAGEVDVTPTR